MALETPPTPAYGPNTFAELAEMARVLKDNDDFLLEQIDEGGGAAPIAIEKALVPLASGYTTNSAYVALTAIKIGTLATLESGVINCPSSFGAAVYYTIGTLPTAYRPIDGKHRMGTAGVYTSTGIKTVQFRVASTGALQILSQEALSAATYLMTPALNWTVGG